MPKILLVVDQGTNFNSVITLTDDNNDPLNTTGYAARAQIRKHYKSNTHTAFTCAVSNGQLLLTMNSNTTANLVPGRHVWDAELVDPSNTVIRIAEGPLIVTPEVSK